MAVLFDSENFLEDIKKYKFSKKTFIGDVFADALLKKVLSKEMTLHECFTQTNKETPSLLTMPLFDAILKSGNYDLWIEARKVLNEPKWKKAFVALEGKFPGHFVELCGAWAFQKPSFGDEFGAFLKERTASLDFFKHCSSVGFSRVYVGLNIARQREIALSLFEKIQFNHTTSPLETLLSDYKNHEEMCKNPYLKTTQAFQKKKEEMGFSSDATFFEGELIDLVTKKVASSPVKLEPLNELSFKSMIGNWNRCSHSVESENFTKYFNLLKVMDDRITFDLWLETSTYAAYWLSDELKAKMEKAFLSNTCSTVATEKKVKGRAL